MGRNLAVVEVVRCGACPSGGHRKARLCCYHRAAVMSALFNFDSLCIVILLLICTCTYLHSMPVTTAILDKNKRGFVGIFWKFARIGERLSPYVGAACALAGFYTLFFQ